MAEKRALITGASSGIGLAVAEKLLEKQWHVTGIARDFSKCALEHEHFEKVTMDIGKIDGLEKFCSAFAEKEPGLKLLVNNAGTGYFAPHEEIPVKKIQEMVNTNLTAPLVLTRGLLRLLKKNSGYVINISSIAALQAGRFGAVYSATKSGLTHFGKCLFEEARKSGVRVVTVHPEIVKTGFFDELNFGYAEDPESYISAGEVADAVEMILGFDPVLVSDITIRAQKFMIDKKR